MQITGLSYSTVRKCIKNETLESFLFSGRRLFHASYIDARFK